MNLIVFPLKHENPFPVKVNCGEPVKLDEKSMILCSGIGSGGVNNLGRVLFDHPEIENIFEFGSAASVNDGKIGKIYECTTFLGLDGVVVGTSGRLTKLPIAAVTGDDNLYTGEKFSWAGNIEFPVIYTMETLRFRNLAKEFRKPFVSIRLVTDDGSGNIREQVAQQINLSKKRIRELFIALETVN